MATSVPADSHAQPGKLAHIREVAQDFAACSPRPGQKAAVLCPALLASMGCSPQAAGNAAVTGDLTAMLCAAMSAC